VSTMTLNESLRTQISELVASHRVARVRRQDFLKANNLKCSMSRRGNCHDNAVAESFFQLLKRERIKRKIYSTRELAKQDVFDYIEMFYNSVRKHGSNAMLSSVEYERRYFAQLGTV